MTKPEAALEDREAPERPAFAVTEGRYLRMEPLGPEHAAALHETNRVDDGIRDHLACGPFEDEAACAGWLAGAAGRPDPMFFALIDRARGAPGGVASCARSSGRGR